MPAATPAPGSALVAGPALSELGSFTVGPRCGALHAEVVLSLCRREPPGGLLGLLLGSPLAQLMLARSLRARGLLAARSHACPFLRLVSERVARATPSRGWSCGS